MTTFNNVNLNTIQIFIIGDRQLIKPALQVYLEAEIDLEIIGYSDNGTIALAAMETRIPDVVIIDSEMSEPDGLTLIRTISDRFHQTKVLVLTNNYERQHIIQSIKMGARGYLLQGTPPKELVSAIRSINLGYFQLGPGLLEKLAINNHTKNFIEYDHNYNENQLGYLFNKFETEFRERSRQLVDSKIDENNHRLNDKLELKLHQLKIKQSDNSLYLKKLEKKLYLLLNFQIGFLIFCLIDWISAR